MQNKSLIPSLLMLTLMLSCYKVPITDRKQMNLLPESMLMDMSLTSYKQFLADNKVVDHNKNAATVRRVGSKMSGSIETYLKKNGHGKRVKDYKWEFNLVEDKLVNAWCMPGGKIVFYSGIMPITLNESGVAVVMSHEIAHAIARHGNERVSQQLLLQAGGISLALLLKDKPKEAQAIFLAAYGLGATIGLSLPFSRAHEAEADQMGLVFMALAGYDPNHAVAFWERMEANSSGAPPEFLSTHPSHQTRIRKIKEFLPEAMKYYKPQ